jgi:hypothetical protein
MSMSRAHQGIADNKAPLKGFAEVRQRSRGIREAKESDKMNDVSLTWETARPIAALSFDDLLTLYRSPAHTTPGASVSRLDPCAQSLWSMRRFIEHRGTPDCVRGKAVGCCPISSLAVSTAASRQEAQLRDLNLSQSDSVAVFKVTDGRQTETEFWTNLGCSVYASITWVLHAYRIPPRLLFPRIRNRSVAPLA